MNTKKILFHALQAATVATFVAGCSMSKTGPDHHATCADKKCSGDKGCCGDKKCSGEKSCAGDKTCSGDKKCSGDKTCATKK